MLLRLLFSPLRLAVALFVLTLVFLVEFVRFAFSGYTDLRVLWRNICHEVLFGFRTRAPWIYSFPVRWDPKLDDYVSELTGGRVR